MSLAPEHPRHYKRPYSVGELIADGFIHAAALVAGLIAFAVLFVKIASSGDTGNGLAIAVYAAGFFLLFGFSCAYNMTPPSPLKWLLRRFDHAAIYLMIAGTYTALLAQLPDHALALTLAGIVWAGALVGIGLKLIWPGRFDNASIIFYLALGWVAIFALKPLLAALPTSTMALIAIGGLLYSVGVVFYRWHSLKYQNAIWHSFVLAAAGCHYAGIAQAIAAGA